MLPKISVNDISISTCKTIFLVVKEIVYEPPVSWRRTTPSISKPHNDITSSRTNRLQTAASDAAEIVVLSDEEDSQGFYITDASGKTNQGSNHPGIYITRYPNILFKIGYYSSQQMMLNVEQT